VARGARSRVTVGMAKVRVSIVLMTLAPLIVFSAVLLVQNGVVSPGFGLDLMTLKIGLWVSLGALAFSVLSFVLSLGQFRRLGAITLLVLVTCAGISGLFVWQARTMAVAGPSDTSTNLVDAPAMRATDAAPMACPGVEPIPRQIALEAASYVLVQQGFSITDAQTFSVRGVRKGFWFGLPHEAVIRIRPGRTDVRVVARYDHSDGGATCRVAENLVAGLQGGR